MSAGVDHPERERCVPTPAAPSTPTDGRRVRGRFAPSPTGLLHLGNAFTALVAWLQARQVGGDFVLRMEDVDRARSKPEYEARILEDLRWLGLDWDEGPDVGGPRGPYRQSERYPRYEAALARLAADGWLYPCYCSRADLASAASAPHGLASEGPAYPGWCRHLTPEEQRMRARRKTPALRFALPEGRGVAFADGIAGMRTFPPGAGGDFVVKRADGMVAYQLAVVVDDAQMGVTDVVRGWDLLDSTPRQLYLYEALGLRPPRFAHVPLLAAPDGSRLAKRDHAITLAGMRERGIRPETLVGWLAHLAGCTDRPEPVQPNDLMGRLDFTRIPRERISVPQRLWRLLLERA
ncbi:tRNA glutamyl-Q(34) synthetase GluQRS [Alicyclobacillus sp.]|uniref:tRNA glutamyl-Q(34) synthetase GluQRS n=1 Tax=Alicyclobacillus sp. TaxID=61169 RepID=UPI0025C5241F|nr:tRNA glutamyl-Q(34) synthetase GluQRS [Alicyclobacillus sp.]MCL6517669.1 tRNA glutamyl-Q(34) synthetase GluQRS [Alicyclobacillus sp.]